MTSQSFPQDKYEVVYIDDNSDDESFLILGKIEKPRIVRLLNSRVNMDERVHTNKL